MKRIYNNGTKAVGLGDNKMLEPGEAADVTNKVATLLLKLDIIEEVEVVEIDEGLNELVK